MTDADHCIDRRSFLATAAAASFGAAATPGAARAASSPSMGAVGFPAVWRSKRARPVVISDTSGYHYRNGGPQNALEKAFSRIVAGDDVLDSLIAGVNIPELDPEETGIGYGGLPNADGVVQLDSCCMHGPRRQAGGVAAIEGVRTPSLVAKAVMELTDHHLIVGKGAQDFARQLGFTVEEDLNTPRSRELWLEWKRRIDPSHWLDPRRDGGGGDDHDPPARLSHDPAARQAALDAGLSMVRDGLIPEHSFWGTINCDGINSNGDICGVTTTSGLSWKIPGRVGDSPILGAGLYVDNDVGACGSTGRGEANLYNLSSFLVVEEIRRGATPKDACMAALRRIAANTIEPRLLDERGRPNFNVRFFALNKAGDYAGCAMYASGEAQFGVCTESGAELMPLEPLYEG